jgi:hypothetical protein
MPLEAEEKAMIAHSDLVYALSQIDSFIDVTEEDLLRIYHLAMNHAHLPLGRCCGGGSTIHRLIRTSGMRDDD